MTDRRRSSPSPPPSEKLHKGAASVANAGKGVKAKMAQVHGTGEALRGHATAAVDRAMDNPEAARKNAELAHKGEREMDTGRFSGNTKVNEGERDRHTGEGQMGYNAGRTEASPVRHGQQEPVRESGVGGLGHGPGDTRETVNTHESDRAERGGVSYGGSEAAAPGHGYRQPTEPGTEGFSRGPTDNMETTKPIHGSDQREQGGIGYDRKDASPVRHEQRDPTESGAGGFGRGPKDTEATGRMYGADQAGQGGVA